MNTKKKYGIRDLERRLGKLTVGEFIHAWRAAEEMSLKDFGNRIGMSVANLCDVEKGRKGVSPEKAAAIAFAIDVPPELLIRLALEEQLRAAGLNYTVAVKPAA